MRWVTSTVTIALVLMTASSAVGQLTKDDIAELQKRAVEEGWTFEVGENSATSRSIEELTGLKVPDNWQAMAPFKEYPDKVDLPVTFDWRTLDGCTPVKDQASCGSCWAFATVGPLECAIKIRDGITVDLSEQWLLSCNRDRWDCTGGWYAHDYHQWKGDRCSDSGAVYEVELPYAATELECACPYNHHYWINGWGYIGNSYSVPSVSSIKQAIMEYGPISVGVSVNSAFQAYTTGVFSGCEDGSINHAVVLVGWDDSQGTEGVWIMRNSWGPGWGEEGYMRMPYNCSLIGYAASYIDYNLPGIFFGADTTFGWSPITISFEGSTGIDVDSWKWYFGDGDSAMVQSPVHIYQNPGVYDVTMQTNSGGEIREVTKPDYVVVVADTMRAPEVPGSAGSPVVVTVTANNSAPVQYIKIPFTYGGDLPLTFDSFSTAGCRTDYFQIKEYLAYDTWNKQITIKLMSADDGSSPDLEPGTGSIAKLYFKVGVAAVEGQSTPISISGYGSYLPAYYGALADYEIPAINGRVYVPSDGLRGDVDASGEIDIADLVYLVAYAFSSGPEPIPLEAADLDCSGGIDIADIVYMVNYMFVSGPAPCPL